MTNYPKHVYSYVILDYTGVVSIVEADHADLFSQCKEMHSQLGVYYTYYTETNAL